MGVSRVWWRTRHHVIAALSMAFHDYDVNYQHTNVRPNCGYSMSLFRCWLIRLSYINYPPLGEDLGQYSLLQTHLMTPFLDR
jgi:hypothetical protein